MKYSRQVQALVMAGSLTAMTLTPAFSSFAARLDTEGEQLDLC